MEDQIITEQTLEMNQDNQGPILYTQEQVDQIKTDLNDKYLRIFAEFENYKKRTQREKDEIRTSIKASLLSPILDLDSDLSIAASNSQDPGIKLIMSKMEKFLTNQGIQSIQTDTYDPDLHEVISIQEIGIEGILKVVSKGYSIDGKPFRYPKVILGK